MIPEKQNFEVSPRMIPKKLIWSFTPCIQLYYLLEQKILLGVKVHSLQSQESVLF